MRYSRTAPRESFFVTDFYGKDVLRRWRKRSSYPNSVFHQQFVYIFEFGNNILVSKTLSFHTLWIVRFWEFFGWNFHCVLEISRWSPLGAIILLCSRFLFLPVSVSGIRVFSLAIVLLPCTPYAASCSGVVAILMAFPFGGKRTSSWAHYRLRHAVVLLPFLWQCFGENTLVVIAHRRLRHAVVLLPCHYRFLTTANAQ